MSCGRNGSAEIFPVRRCALPIGCIVFRSMGTSSCWPAGDQFELISRHSLGEPSRSTPAIAGGRMYLRTQSHLVSIGGKPSAGDDANR